MIGWLRVKGVEIDANAVFSPNGALLAVGSQEEPLQVWDVAARRLITTLPATDSSAVAFSPDGATLAIGDGASVKLWDTASLRLTATVHIAGAVAIASVAFSPGGATLAVTTTHGGPVQLLDVASRRVVAVLPAVADTETATVEFSPNGAILAVNSSSIELDSTLKGPATTQLWNAHDGQLLATLAEPAGIWAGSMAFSSDGSVLATGVNQGSVQLWDIAAAVPSATIDAGDSVVSAVAFSPDGTTLAVAGVGGTQLRDVPAGKLIKTLPAATAVAFSPDGKILAIGAAAGTQLWDVPAGKLIKTLPAAAGSVVSALAFSPGGTRLAAAVGGGIQLWDLPAGQLVKTLTSANVIVVSLAFSLDGAFLAAAGEVLRGTANGATRLWQVPAGRLVTTLPTFGQTLVSAVAFSPDGKLLAVGTSSGTQLWNFHSLGTTPAMLLPTGPGETPLAFAPGTDALAISTVHGIQLWDAATGQQFASRPAKGASQSPLAVAISTEGTLATIAVDGQAHQVQLWRMPYLTHPAAALCAQAGVPFSSGTWTEQAQGIPYQPTCS